MRLFLGTFTPEVTAGPPSGFRPTPLAARHVTLVFVGEEDRWREVAAGAAAVAGRHASFLLTFDRLVGLPRSNAARVAAVEARPEPAFARLVAELRAKLAAYGSVEREVRPPRPHVTVGRSASPRPLDEGVLGDGVVVAVRSFWLVQSVLDPGGARYERLEEFILGG